MPTTWTIAIDWDRNGNITDTYDDVSRRVTAADWFIGFRQPYEDVAQDTMLNLKLTNTDRRYSPENSASPLFGKLNPYRPVRVQSFDGTTTRTHWTGWIESIQPSVNQYGEGIVEIKAAGPGLFFADAQTSIALQENRRTDEIISTLLQQVLIPPPLSQSWLLDVPGQAELGVSTYLSDPVIASSLESGKTTLAYAADNWARSNSTDSDEPATFNVYRAIKDVVAAERGRFFFNREGQAVFWNRHHLLTQSTVAATFDNSMTGMTYEYAGLGEFKNEVTVACYPRTVSPNTTDLLWSLTQPLTLNPGETRKFSADYKESGGNNNERVGGKDFTLQAVSFSQGSASIRPIFSANRATIELVNVSSSQPCTLITLEIRGRKITSYGKLEATSKDNVSAAYYGQRTLNMNLASVDNLDYAQTIADFERARRSQPSGKVKTLTLLSQAELGGGQHTQQLALTLGDLIRVQEAQTSHDEAYFIIGEAHRLYQNGDLFQTTWYLESATETDWFRLDYSHLDTAVLAY